MLHTDGTGEPGSALLKRAALLFERLLIVPIGLGGFETEIMSFDRFLSLIDKKDDFCKRPEFKSIFCRPEDCGLHFSQLQEASFDIKKDDLWGPLHGEKFVHFTRGLVSHQAETAGVKPGTREEHELLKYYIGTISADYRLLAYMSKKSDYSGLLSRLHEDAVIATHASRAGSETSVIEHVAGLSCFDFASLSWSDIYKLRSDGFIRSFRQKMSEWTLYYRYATDIDSFVQDLRTVIDDATSTVISKSAPRPKRTILAGLAGFLPFGIGTLWSSAEFAQNINSDLSLGHQLGWLFFINRSREMARDVRISS